MRSKEENLKSGLSIYDVQRQERTQAVYDFALEQIKLTVPNAPAYLQAAMTRELLLDAVGNRSF